MKPCVRAIQTSTGPVSSWNVCPTTLTFGSEIKWLLCRLVNGSARAPTKDVPSCEKPEGAARRQRTQDLRMRISTAIASRNGERRELKHLSIGRKRKRM